MERIDAYPTHYHKKFGLRAGQPYPFGATLVPGGGINFSIFSSQASRCTLVIFEKEGQEPLVEIPFPEEFRVGHVFAMVVFGLDPEDIEYGYRMDGLYSPHAGHRFDYSKILLDPYARAIGGQETWGLLPRDNEVYRHRAQIVPSDFDWEADRLLEIPIEELIIYEMHVRGFTQHPSSGVKHPGTFAAIREKIPYFKQLGINCIELMPIFEFDELENHFVNPQTGQGLINYWGYSTVGFFAPKAGYAASGRLGMQVDELKALVKELHKNGIEIMLDVVFNHTGEGDEQGETISFRGIDNKTYYMLTPDGHYFNFSGTGNTMNCNNPVVRNLVLDCLRYWVAEYHIDGFRFDLASILGRDPLGHPLANPPLIEALAYDPILAKCKLIAEAWDAGGLYQVGSFPAYDRWGEWNGKYRDAIRRFLRGDEDHVGEMVQRIQGSPDLYPERGPQASVNFVTAHDGFTLLDLYSYNEKHNQANGEDGRDGANDNYSWNCGHEGESNDKGINQLRRQQVRNAVALLMVSQGVPMILMGDEMGRTQHGNNNTYCQDVDWNWLDWSLLEKNQDIFRFFKNCIAFRKAHPVLRNNDHFQNKDYVGSGYNDVTWHGIKAWVPNWDAGSRTFGFMLCGEHAHHGSKPDDYIYVFANAHWEDHQVELPHPPEGQLWHLFANTGTKSPHDCYEPGHEPKLNNQRNFLVGARSTIILVGR
ncbi:glycogen debranching protein GlgX [Anaerolineales bacterium HSG25]|nr:glycogen debranching protein GlgX [Anaerolineales bacterium HSG25]